MSSVRTKEKDGKTRQREKGEKGGAPVAELTQHKKKRNYSSAPCLFFLNNLSKQWFCKMFSF